VPELVEVVLRDALEDPHRAAHELLEHVLDELLPVLCDVGADGPPVVGVGDPGDQTVALQVIDEARDVARAHTHLLGQLAERQVAVAPEPHEELETSLGEAVALHRALHVLVHALHEPAGRVHPFGAPDRLDADEWLQQVPGLAVVQQSAVVDPQVRVFWEVLHDEWLQFYNPKALSP
jgi:hypothetical protein